MPMPVIYSLYSSDPTRTAILRISHLEKALAEARKELKKSEKEGGKVEEDRAALQAAVADLRAKLQDLGCDEVRGWMCGEEGRLID